MKKLLLVFALFSTMATVSFAFPNVGDSVRYKLFVTIDGKVQFDGVMTKEIIAYDPDKDEYQEHSSNNGNLSDDAYLPNPDEKKWIKADTLSSEIELTAFVRACGTIDAPGKLKRVQVGLKNIKVCEQTMNGGGTTQIGTIPYGYTFFDYEVKRGEHLFRIRQELIAVTFGKSKPTLFDNL